MVRQALGMIEAVGLPVAITAADAAVKSANVKLVGYELAKGSGMILIKVVGDVGAVKAAVEAGSAAAARVGRIVATHVIPRPHQELDCILLTKETVGTGSEAAVETPQEEQAEPEAEEEEPPIAAEPAEEASGEVLAEAETEAVVDEELETVEEEQALLSEEPAAEPADSCNLCHDPDCPRRKGDPRNTCLHYGKNDKEDESV